MHLYALLYITRREDLLWLLPEGPWLPSGEVGEVSLGIRQLREGWKDTKANLIYLPVFLRSALLSLSAFKKGPTTVLSVVS